MRLYSIISLGKNLGSDEKGKSNRGKEGSCTCWMLLVLLLNLLRTTTFGGFPTNMCLLYWACISLHFFIARAVKHTPISYSSGQSTPGVYCTSGYTSSSPQHLYPKTLMLTVNKIFSTTTLYVIYKAMHSPMELGRSITTTVILYMLECCFHFYTYAVS